MDDTAWTTTTTTTMDKTTSSGSGVTTTTAAAAAAEKTPEETARRVLEQMEERFRTMSDAIITKIDEMGDRIEELERSVRDIASNEDDGGR
jgi:aspartate/methionine/tyrosine aminotransferase